jgi:hypothetical protein
MLSIGDLETRSAIEDSAREMGGIVGTWDVGSGSGRKWFEWFEWVVLVFYLVWPTNQLQLNQPHATTGRAGHGTQPAVRGAVQRLGICTLSWPHGRNKKSVEKLRTCS